MAPFSALPYMISPFFQQKIYDWSYFSGLVYERPHFSDISRYMHIFSIQRFFEAACFLGIQWIDVYICLTTSNKWVQKIKGQYMNGSTFQTIEYMNGSAFTKARYMNRVGFEIRARTPVSLLLPSYTPPPTPRAGYSISAKLKIYLHCHMRAGWSESSQGTLWVAKYPRCFQADSEDSSACTDAQMYLSLRWNAVSWLVFVGLVTHQSEVNHNLMTVL